ncbi:hypothetical protein SAMN02745216_02348 [Desulfatibacillum alkenivorans DSM 16219]|jgi:ribosomal protein S14|uniref:Uncharacterized protein n=1 Tax=Desulfatibacillum alkenivorans DSM 16219 TaxID=1121393 RepID=A0A1M6MFU9_9BACT|nr:hypothetical protein [Desulfatibacillum alkenivorans]SHJ82308.1 hypothetical protein SAMN02745216_02348 [Desulfatibacillum alkenivorans DSM 16219]
MAETTKKFKQVCKCEKCGNEAEMIITCSLVEVEEHPEEKEKQKGHATCSQCGNEADIWVEMPKD